MDTFFLKYSELQHKHCCLFDCRGVNTCANRIFLQRNCDPIFGVSSIWLGNSAMLFLGKLTNQRRMHKSSAKPDLRMCSCFSCLIHYIFGKVLLQIITIINALFSPFIIFVFSNRYEPFFLQIRNAACRLKMTFYYSLPLFAAFSAAWLFHI